MCGSCNGTGYEMFVDEGGDVEVVRCDECTRETVEPVTVPEVLHSAVTQLVGALYADGVADPLGATVTLAAVLSDLYRLTGIAAPVGLESWMGA